MTPGGKAPVFPAARWSRKPVEPEEVPRLVADIVSRSRHGESPTTRDLFNQAIDVLCRVDDARTRAAEAITPATPAMTAEEALAAMDQPEWGTPEDVEAVRAALSDAERRATEAEAERNDALSALSACNTQAAELAHRMWTAESRLSAVEARCGLMREALEQIALTRLPIEQSIAAAALAADSVLADHGGKSDQGEKAGNYEAQATIDSPYNFQPEWEPNSPAGGEGKPEPMKATPLMIATLRDELGWHKGWLDICERALNAALAVAPLSRSGDSALVEARKMLEDTYDLLRQDILLAPSGLRQRIDRWLAEHTENQQHGERK